MKYPAQAVWKNKDNDVEVTIISFYGEMNGRFYFAAASGTGIPADELFFYKKNLFERIFG